MFSFFSFFIVSLLLTIIKKMNMLELNWSDRDSIVNILTDHYGIDSKNIKKRLKISCLPQWASEIWNSKLKFLVTHLFKQAKWSSRNWGKYWENSWVNARMVRSRTDILRIVILLLFYEFEKKMNGSFFLTFNYVNFLINLQRNSHQLQTK